MRLCKLNLWGSFPDLHISMNGATILIHLVLLGWNGVRWTQEERDPNTNTQIPVMPLLPRIVEAWLKYHDNVTIISRARVRYQNPKSDSKKKPLLRLLLQVLLPEAFLQLEKRAKERNPSITRYPVFCYSLLSRRHEASRVRVSPAPVSGMFSF